VLRMNDRSRRNGFGLLDIMLAISLASMLFVGLESLIQQERRLSSLMAEKLLLSGVAQWAAREVLSDPRVVFSTSPQGKTLKERLGQRPDLAGVRIAIHKRKLANRVAEVRVMASRNHPVLGRREAEAVILVHE
jgi:hypothetical protein